jgi:hypothetical protein
MDPYYFLIALAIGLFYAYLTMEEPLVVTHYPTPYNLETVYTDKAGICYKYRVNNTTCTSQAKEIPIQT